MKKVTRQKIGVLHRKQNPKIQNWKAMRQQTLLRNIFSNFLGIQSVFHSKSSCIHSFYEHGFEPRMELIILFDLL